MSQYVPNRNSCNSLSREKNKGKKPKQKTSTLGSPAFLRPQITQLLLTNHSPVVSYQSPIHNLLSSLIQSILFTVTQGDLCNLTFSFGANLDWFCPVPKCQCCTCLVDMARPEVQYPFPANSSRSPQPTCAIVSFTIQMR